MLRKAGKQKQVRRRNLFYPRPIDDVMSIVVRVINEEAEARSITPQAVARNWLNPSRLPVRLLSDRALIVGTPEYQQLRTLISDVMLRGSAGLIARGVGEVARLKIAGDKGGRPRGEQETRLGRS